MTNNTIAAVSTAYGRGGIAVIRISGDEAVDIASAMFKPSSGKPLEEYPSNHAVYGYIYQRTDSEDKLRRIDDGLCTIFRAPNSYTGEDVVEISCHGGILITERVLEAVFGFGAVQAGAGEFTRRAFTNGKLSLSQAEAIGMLIDAETDEQLSLAAAQERGIFRDKADKLYERLKSVVTSVYAGVDFPDEDLTLMSDDEIISELRWLDGELDSLCSSYGAVRAVTQGIRTVIVGKPNTGKSSLLNRLVGRDRAIVTDIAGTTRDTVEESVKLGRVLLRLCDTAGIRETSDEVERIGVERSIAELENAELIVAVFDLTREADVEDMELFARIDKLNAAKIAVLNKSDAGETKFDCGLISSFENIATISAKTGEGIDELKATVERLFAVGDIDYDNQAMILNARQNAVAIRAHGYICSALCALESGLTSDTAGLDLESALAELGELDGRRVTEDIVDGIFHHFCVGK
ncbi:MAG: tRNA uridine-5-carboxymethylaminomethyl(34) synthesis GTPase MnmE [Clostridiales bacterium]|nr:tRNA uridine-5-carboxymethylaminomethyl(34) synthesis GTPase MnmE [Clostridiales bacterium]